MKTAVVILNWNTCGYLRRWIPVLLDSLQDSDAGVFVADNGSTDGSPELVEKEFPSVGLIRFEKNYGFTGGYNRAIEEIAGKCKPEFIVLMNSDIEVPGGWLPPLEKWMDSHPECGVCGPKLHALDSVNGEYIRSDRFEYAGAAGGYIDRFGYPFCRGRVLSRVETDCGQYPDPADVLWVSGACLMTRTALWKEYGGLDDRFFAHMEEIDYCWRLALAGYCTTVIPDSTVYHLGAGTLHQDSPFKLKLNFRNNLLLLEKNLPRSIGWWRASVRITIRKCLDLLAAFVFLVCASPGKAKAVMQAHREYRKLTSAGNGAGRCVHSKTDVKGLSGIPVIPAAIIYGKRIFKKISEL